MKRADKLKKKYDMTNNILETMHNDLGNPQLSREQIDSLFLSTISYFLEDISISLAMLVDDKCEERIEEVNADGSN
jgi:hypothetical protein